jgi:subtilisin family serine protease
MKKTLFILTLVVMISVLIGCIQKEETLQAPDQPLALKSASVNSKYIVVLNEDAVLTKSDFQTRNGKVKEKGSGLLKKHAISGAVEEVFESALQGFTVNMAPGQAKKLAGDPDIKFVEEDQIFTLSQILAKGKPGGGGTPPAQVTPWGITRVGGGGAAYPGTNVVWIIDTGVDLTHPDLNVSKTLGKSFISRVSSPNDDNGHGSHVAGIIAAKNNTVGVIGVAPGAMVVPVKVLDRNGSGTTSGVIAGVNYVAANGKAGDVANMSLGGGISAALDAAVLNASKVVKFALAAGNESNDANLHSPARVNGPNIFTVSAMDSQNKWAYFSNFGNPPIDYCAPGVSIYSTYKGGGYATMSGTSMAAPHVAGLLLLGNIVSDGSVIGDPDGNPDNIAHH